MQSRKDILASLVFLGGGVITWIECFRIRVISFGGLGGDFFPKLVSTLLIILSSIWFVASLVRFSKEKRINSLINRKVRHRRAPVLFVVAFVFYIIALTWFGFVIPTVFLSLTIYLLLKDRIRFKDLFVGVSYSILVVFVVWFLFTKVLGLMLPTGRF